MGQEWIGDIGGGAADGAKIGALVGTVVPGVGNLIGGAVGGVIGGAVGLARNLTGQPRVDAEAPALIEAAQEVAGVLDEAQAVETIAADPDKLLAFKSKVLDIREATEKARMAHVEALTQKANEDRASARDLTAKLGAAGSRVVWVPAVVSSLIVMGFFVTLFVVLGNGIPDKAEAVVNVLLGILGALVTGVANFWFGSSVGSQRKTDLLAAERK